ncbi:hypothetical protein Tco_0972603 [Tanacetum coccineum]
MSWKSTSNGSIASDGRRWYISTQAHGYSGKKVREIEQQTSDSTYSARACRLKDRIFRTITRCRVIESCNGIRLRFSTTKVLGVEVLTSRSSRVSTGVHGVHDEKRVWFEVELQGAQGDREAEVFQSLHNSTKSGSGLSKIFWAEIHHVYTSSVQGTPSSANDLRRLKICLGFLVWLAILSKGAMNRLRIMVFHKSGGNTRNIYCYGCREDSNETAFAVAAVEKIYQTLSRYDSDDSDGVLLRVLHQELYEAMMLYMMELSFSSRNCNWCPLKGVSRPRLSSTGRSAAYR